MANEATVRTFIRVTDGNLNYTPTPAQFRAGVDGQKGPTPGFLTVNTDGENVLFDELVTPGLCRIVNLDESNFIEYGLHDGSIFHPWGEGRAGQEYVFHFSRNFREEVTVAPGTGSTAEVNEFYIKANTAPCGVIVDCFEAGD